MDNDSKRSPAQAMGLQQQPTVTEVERALKQLCVENGLSYGGHAPIAVSPGVWLFYASRCDRWGSCRQRQYFATQLTERWTLC